MNTSKKTLLLFSGAVLFMYLAFAVNYFLDGQWFELPTRILMIVLTVFHCILLALHFYSSDKSDIKNER